MGFFSAMSKVPYRKTHDGRRVLALPVLFGTASRKYVVPDDIAHAVERRYRLFYVLTFFIGIPVVALNRPPFWVWILAFLIWPGVGMRMWVLRGVPRISLSSDDLVPLDHRAADLAYAVELGETRLWLLFIATLVMAALGVSVIVSDGVWWAWFGLMMFGTAAVAIARSIRMVRRSRRRSALP